MSGETFVEEALRPPRTLQQLIDEKEQILGHRSDSRWPGLRNWAAPGDYYSDEDWAHAFYTFSHALLKANDRLEELSKVRPGQAGTRQTRTTKRKAEQEKRQALSNVRAIRCAFRAYLGRYFNETLKINSDLASYLKLDPEEASQFNSSVHVSCTCKKFSLARHDGFNPSRFKVLEKLRSGVFDLSLRGLDARPSGTCDCFGSSMGFKILIPHDLTYVAKAFFNMEDLVFLGDEMERLPEHRKSLSPMHLTFPFKDMVKPIYRRYLKLIFFHPESSFCWYRMLPDGDRVTVIPLEIVQKIFEYFRDSPPPPLPTCDYRDPLTNLKCENTEIPFEECFICTRDCCKDHMKECEDCGECGCLPHMVQCAGSCDTFMCPACFKHIDKNGPYWCRDCSTRGF